MHRLVIDVGRNGLDITFRIPVGFLFVANKVLYIVSIIFFF
jgi:hypothetical protein